MDGDERFNGEFEETRGVLLVQWWWDGKQYIKPLRLSDYDEAERVRQRVEAAIHGLKKGKFPKASRLLDQGYPIRDIIFPHRATAHLLDGDADSGNGDGVLVSQLADADVQHLRIHDTDGHGRRVQSKLKHPTRFTDDGLMAAFNAATLDGYIDDRQTSKARPQTIKGELATVRAMLNWAVEAQQITRSPIGRFPTVKISDADPFHFKDDIDRIIKQRRLS